MLPKDMLKVIPKDFFDTETGTLRILHEEEWRSLGITQVLFFCFYSVDGRVWDGHIMRFMFRNRIFFCSSRIPLSSADVLGGRKIINQSSVEKDEGWGFRRKLHSVPSLLIFYLGRFSICMK
jgi:hypothetical protein